MRIETLKPITFLSIGKRLRTVMALAISHCELFAGAADKQAFTDFCVDAGTKAGGDPGLSLPATQAIVSNAGTTTVKNSAGTTISAAATYAVAANAVTGVSLPATIAGVTNAVKINIGAGSGSGNFATFTVANGVITAVVLSAS